MVVFLHWLLGNSAQFALVNSDFTKLLRFSYLALVLLSLMFFSKCLKTLTLKHLKLLMKAGVDFR